MFELDVAAAVDGAAAEEREESDGRSGARRLLLKAASGRCGSIGPAVEGGATEDEREAGTAAAGVSRAGGDNCGGGASEAGDVTRDDMGESGDNQILGQV